MNMNGTAGDGEVKITRHRPERLGELAVVGSICCSSCCCCCCVHSFGGIAGSMVGSALAVSDTSKPGAPSTSADATLVISMYWSVLIALSVLVFGVCALVSEFWYGVGAVLLGGPTFQLITSLIVLPIAATRKGPAREASMRALGRITLFGFLGSVVGGVLLLGGGALLLGLMK